MPPLKISADLLKSVQAILKNQLNRRLEQCEMQLVETEKECRLVFRLHGARGEQNCAAISQTYHVC